MGSLTFLSAADDILGEAGDSVIAEDPDELIQSCEGNNPERWSLYTSWVEQDWTRCNKLALGVANHTLKVNQSGTLPTAEEKCIGMCRERVSPLYRGSQAWRNPAVWVTRPRPTAARRCPITVHRPHLRPIKCHLIVARLTRKSTTQHRKRPSAAGVVCQSQVTLAKNRPGARAGFFVQARQPRYGKIPPTWAGNHF